MSEPAFEFKKLIWFKASKKAVLGTLATVLTVASVAGVIIETGRRRR